MKRLLHIMLLTVVVCYAQFAVAQCSGSFTFTSNFCHLDSMQFTFTGTANAVSWDFGDPLSGPSNKDTNRILKHQFTDTGNYTITSIASSGSCLDTVKQTVYITSKPRFNFSYLNGCFGLQTEFVNTSSVGYKDSLTYTKWEFGDSTSSLVFSPSHLYTSDGNKVISLIIGSKLGCNDTAKSTINIKSPITYEANQDSVCQNGKVNFMVNQGSEVVSTYQWNFGDGNSSGDANPEYAYDQAGIKYFDITLTFPDSSKCTFDGDSIMILGLPDANFTIITDSIQCFKGNNVCIQIDSFNQPITYRNILWDDGSSTPVSLTDSILCHVYNNTSGSTYKITHEVIDINGCAIRFKDSTENTIIKDPKADFTFDKSGGCFKSKLEITNTSNLPLSAIDKFYWRFGDGNVDSVNWNNFNHTYTANGDFNVTLQIQDTFGCVDTFKNASSINNISYVVDAALDTVIDYCRLNNRFRFKQTPIPGATITWYFNDPNSWYYGDPDSATTFNPSRHFYSVGHYYPSVRISKLGCDSFLKLDTIVVYGPYSRASIQNQFQCQIKDTVYFTNISSYFRNEHIQTQWKINDPYNSNCVIDSKNGLNKDSNCNISLDSLKYKHMFTPGREMCYTGFLVQTDTVIGCADSFRLSIPLMRPKADTGLRVFFNSQPCVGPEQPKEVFISLHLTQPNCGRQSYYVMWDSLCAEESGNFNSHWELNQYRHNYDYNNLPCDSNGYVSMGLIVQNGLDSFGNVCRDTGFYHHIIKFGVINPTIASTYKSDSLYCPYSSHSFYMADSLQDSLNLIIWDFGDGTIDTVTTLGKVNHTYQSAGIYRVSSYILHNNGCDGDDTFNVKIGIQKNIQLDNSFLCLGDSIQIFNKSNYWLTDTPSLFTSKARELAGLESTFWDLGDGNGFSKIGPSAFLRYPKIGDYTVKMAVKDSVGCRDTLTLPVPFRIFDMKSQIYLPQDTLVCPQVVQLFSASSVYDSINNFGHADDSVKRVEWTFEDGSGASIEKNPSKFFGKGAQRLKLISENTRGCKDSVIDSFFIVSPIAKFNSITDTLGCQPHTITFKNESKNANDFTWFFKNASNNILNTASQANVNFIYANYGTYDPQLIARRQALNNGIPISCADTFPLLVRGDTAVKITVYEKPVPRYTHITDCSNYTTNFTNTTVVTTDTIKKVWWTFGDGDSSSIANPFHQYADTGVYRVVLHVVVGKGCQDSIVKLVYISPIPEADFNAASVCEEEQTQFNDISNAFNDVIYLWQWDLGDGAFNYTKNPSHLYSKDSSYRVHLKVTNRAGCFDTISKMVTVHDKPTVDFNYVNACKNLAHIFDGVTTISNSSLTYRWEFGDGTSAPGKNTTHIYNGIGNYSVKFKVESNYGCKDSSTKTVRVHPNPASSNSVNNSVQCQKGNRFDFTNTSSIPLDTISYSYWYTSDGGSGFNKDFSAIFTYPDSFLVTLISQSNFGCRDTTTRWIELLESPKVAPLLSDLSMCVNGDSIQLLDSASSISGLQRRAWFINNLNQGSDSIINYKFNKVGQNEVMLLKHLNNGCKDTAITQVTIHPKPNAFIKVASPEQCFGTHQFSFSDSSWISNLDGLDRIWYLGNGDTSILAAFNYQYALADSFTVSLIASSSNNCKDTTAKQVIVHPEPIANFNRDTLVQCFRSNRFQFTDASSVYGSTLTYGWYFNQEGTSTAENPAFTFPSYGVKDVKLIAASIFGCKDSVSKLVEVYPMPVAVPTINIQDQCLNDQNFIFNDNSTIPYGSLTRTWLWYDGNTDTSISLVKSYLKDTLYEHRLVSTSFFDCADTAVITNTVLPLPNVQFAINDTGQCVNRQQFIFENLTTTKDGPFESYWNYNDGNRDTSFNPTHFYLNPGIYKVQLSVNSSRNCRDTFNLELEVYPKPQALVTVNDSAQCFNSQNFQFYGGSTISKGNIIGYQWDTLNSPFIGGKDTMLVFPQPGSYTVRYSVESNERCFDTTQQLVVVHPNPISSFTILDSLQCENDNEFMFTSTTSLQYGSFVDSWYVGQSFFSDKPVADSMFFSEDTLFISLVNTSGKGCRDTAAKPIYVVPAPHTRFGVNDSGQCFGSNQFMFVNQSDIEDGALRYNWSFGDGNSSIVAEPSHSYADHGDYNVQLIATSYYDCRDTQYLSMLVHPEPNALFSVNQASQCRLGNRFIFTNQSSIDSTSLSFDWVFGDNSASQQVDPTHSYASYGTYSVKLRTQSNYGCIDSWVLSSVVNPMPLASFTANDFTQCINIQNFEFQNTSSIPLGKISSYSWTTNGVATSNINPYNYLYPVSGPFNVSLETVSDSNCRDTVVNLVRVFPKPISRILVNDSVQCLRGNYYLFNNNSFDSFGIQSHKWIVGGAIVSTADTFATVYKTAGLKGVTQVAVSNNLCEDTTSIQVRVKPMPDPGFERMKAYYCENEPSTLLQVNQGGGTFYGKNIVNQSYMPRKLWDDTITYSVTIEGCTDSSKQYTKVYPLPRAYLGNDTTICKHETILLHPMSWNSRYLWHNGLTDSVFRVGQPGNYWVTATNICGADADTINISIRDINCRFFLPTAFTPNGNGINDRYKPVVFDIDKMNYKIFNRWGGKIFEGNESDLGWDGTFMGVNSPDGYYIIVVDYSYKTELRQVKETTSEVFYLLK